MVYSIEMRVYLEDIYKKAEETVSTQSELVSFALIHPGPLEKQCHDNPTLVLQVNERVPTSGMSRTCDMTLTCSASSVTMHFR